MAKFDKFANLSPQGWSSSTGTQTMGAGKEAHIGLSGGSLAGVELVVKSADPTICVVHEEPRPARFPDWRHFLLTALSDGQTTVDAFVPATSTKVASMTVKVTGHAGVRLIFFPGERIQGATTVGAIYVVGGKGESIKAAGGPPTGYKDPMQGGHTAEPTPPGNYVLGPRIHVTTAGWPFSVIPWGAGLRLNAAGEVEYEKLPRVWRPATGLKGDVTVATLAYQRRSGLKPDIKVVNDQTRGVFIDPATGKLRSATWEKNDFGRWGWNLRRGGHPTAYYVHTTPQDEHATAQKKAVLLSNSHGCIHLVPAERDRLINAGFLKQGVPFEVRPYSETGPP
jgi:hypothetical protein